MSTVIDAALAQLFCITVYFENMFLTVGMFLNHEMELFFCFVE